jgi:hypothetical protein
MCLGKLLWFERNRHGLILAILLAAGFFWPTTGKASDSDLPPNTLTESEKAAGWQLLWDGKSTEGWRCVNDQTFPTEEWKIADGMLTVREAMGGLSTGRGNIISREQFADFELLVDFKIAPGANSGIKYLVQPNLDRENQTGAGPAVGCEFQILDDERHPDAKLGREGNRTLGSLYDLIPAAADKKPNPIGQWNTARILVQGMHVEHWLNGVKVLEYERGSAAFRARGSKASSTSFQLSVNGQKVTSSSKNTVIEFIFATSKSGYCR